MSQLESRRSLAIPLAVLAIAAFFLLGPSRANEPGTGATAFVERQYLEQVIDHHYSALRMTELAAGADLDTIDAASSASSPSVDRAARAEKPEVLALARRSRRLQREEIETAREFLRDWYGTDHEPALSPQATQTIAHLASLPAGEAFDAEFLRTFSAHHAWLLIPTLRCLIGADLDHRELDRYCNNMLRNELADIEEMRALLCRFFGDCGYVVPL